MNKIMRVCYVLLVLTFVLFISSCGGSGQETKKEPGITIQDGYSISIDKPEVDFTYNYRDGRSEAIIVNVSFKGDGVLIGYPEGSEHLQDWLKVETIASDTSTATFKIDWVSPSQMNWKQTTGLNIQSGTIRFVTGSVKEKKEIYTDLKVNYIFEDEIVSSVDNILVESGQFSFGDFVELRQVMGRDSIITSSAAMDWIVSTEQPWIKIAISEYNGSEIRKEKELSIMFDTLLANIGENTGEIRLQSVDGKKQHLIHISFHVDEPYTTLSQNELTIDGFKGEKLKSGSFTLCFPLQNFAEQEPYYPEVEIDSILGLSLVFEYEDESGQCRNFYVEVDTSLYAQAFEDRQLTINALFPGKKIPHVIQLGMHIDDNKLGLSHYSSSNTAQQGDFIKEVFTVQAVTEQLPDFEVVSPQEWLSASVQGATVEYEIDTRSLDFGQHSGEITIKNSNSNLAFYVHVNIVESLDSRQHMRIDVSQSLLKDYGDRTMVNFSVDKNIAYFMYMDYWGENKGLYSVNYINGEVNKLDIQNNVNINSFSVSEDGEYIYLLHSNNKVFSVYSLLNDVLLKEIVFEFGSANKELVPFIQSGKEYIQISSHGIYEASSWEKVSDSLNMERGLVSPNGRYYLKNEETYNEKYKVYHLSYRESKKHFDTDALADVEGLGVGFSHNSSKLLTENYRDTRAPLYSYDVNYNNVLKDREFNQEARGVGYNKFGHMIIYNYQFTPDSAGFDILNDKHEVIAELRFGDEIVGSIIANYISPDGMKILSFTQDGFIHVFNAYN